MSVELQKPGMGTCGFSLGDMIDDGLEITPLQEDLEVLNEIP